jgi:hypothetical protein
MPAAREGTMTDFDISNFAALDSQQFAKAVKAASNDRLKEIMKSDQRTAVLDDIFASMPGQFRAEKAGNMDAVIHWNVTGRPDGGTDTYELVIGGGSCTLSPKPAAEPRLSLTAVDVDFLKLVSGNMNPVTAFMMGKLKAKGDLGLAANMANLFETPKP